MEILPSFSSMRRGYQDIGASLAAHGLYQFRYRYLLLRHDFFASVTMADEHFRSALDETFEPLAPRTNKAQQLDQYDESCR